MPIFGQKAAFDMAEPPHEPVLKIAVSEERGFIVSLRINIDECVGCGVCMEICPAIFQLDDEEGKVAIISLDYDDKTRALVNEAIESCPIGCIIP
jgi:ferredoxin